MVCTWILKLYVFVAASNASRKYLSMHQNHKPWVPIANPNQPNTQPPRRSILIYPHSAVEPSQSSTSAPHPSHPQSIARTENYNPVSKPLLTHNETTFYTNTHLQFKFAITTFCTPRIYCWTWMSTYSPQLGSSASARYQALYRAASMSPMWLNAICAGMPEWRQMATTLWVTPSFWVESVF